MKSEKEIRTMYNHIKEDYCVSPSVRETFNWILEIDNPSNSFDFLFHLSDKDSHSK